MNSRLFLTVLAGASLALPAMAESAKEVREQAVSACQSEIQQQSTNKFGDQRIRFDDVKVADNAGSNDYITGGVTIGSGSSKFYGQFTCQTDLCTGKVSMAQLYAEAPQVCCAPAPPPPAPACCAQEATSPAVQRVTSPAVAQVTTAPACCAPAPPPPAAECCAPATTPAVPKVTTAPACCVPAPPPPPAPAAACCAPVTTAPRAQSPVTIQATSPAVVPVTTAPAVCPPPGCPAPPPGAVVVPPAAAPGISGGEANRAAESPEICGANRSVEGEAVPPENCQQAAARQILHHGYYGQIGFKSVNKWVDADGEPQFWGTAHAAGWYQEKQFSYSCSMDKSGNVISSTVGVLH